MDSHKPNPTSRPGVRRYLGTLIFCVCTASTLSAAPPPELTAAAQAAHREGQFEEARLLIQKGDQAYEAGNYAQALQAYAEARTLLGSAPRTSEWKAAATERFCQCSVAHARSLSRQGNRAAALATIEAALAPDANPNHPLALACQAELLDPIRSNPALTPEHTADVVKVRNLLYTAQGAYDLGKFDEAKSTYEQVLRIDPYNTSARRGLEKVASSKSDYASSSTSQTRATLLAEVDAQWETDHSKPGDSPNSIPFDAEASITPTYSASIEEQLQSILLPKIALDQVTLGEAIDFLRARSREYDTTELDPAKKGVNFTVNLGDPNADSAKQILAKRFSLQLTQVPLATALKYICDQTQTTFSCDAFSVMIRPLNADRQELVTRSYRVPPDFLTSLSANAPSEQSSDPFSDSSAPKPGLLTTRLSAQQALSLQGVAFPDGASAILSPNSNTLTLTNTAANHDIVQQLIELQSKSAPAAVAVEVTMIHTETTSLNELGFDWLINPASLGSDSLYAGGGTAGNAGGRTGLDFTNPGAAGFVAPLTPANPSDPIAKNIITSGLRSGDQAIRPSSIDDLLQNFSRASQETRVAPGVLSVMGVFSNESAVQMMLRGLSQAKNTDVIAKPSVVSKSGQSATIEMAREFIYPTEYEPPEVPANFNGFGGGSAPVTPATPTAFTTRNVGILLEVMPQVDATQHFVDLTLSPSLVEFDGFVNFGSPINSIQNSGGLFSILPISGSSGSRTTEMTPNAILMPVFSTQRTNSQVTIANGSTIVLAGLLKDQVQEVNDRVPVFGDLPLIGKLFTSNAKKRSSKVVLFLVHVRVTDPTGNAFSSR